MKFKVGALALVVLLAAGVSFISLSSFAGALQDADSDLVPDGFDNCVNTANGPSQASDQVDTDNDGYGNACDCDLNNNGVVDVNDFAACGAAFNTAVGNPSYNAACDSNGNNTVDVNDFAACGASFNNAPGPSGLACAGTIPCP